MKIRIIIIIILVFVISISIGLVYLNNVFIPKKLKPLLIQNLANQIQRKVTLGALNYQLFKGFILKDLAIFDGPPYTDEIFLSVKKVQFNILIFPFLKTKKIIIPSLYIDSPLAHIKYKADKTYNIPLAQPTTAKETNLLISRIIIAHGKVSIEDQTKSPYFIRQIEELNTRLALTLPEDIKFNLQGLIQNTDKTKTAVFLKGKYGLKDKSFSLDTKIEDIPLAEYSLYLTNLPVYDLKARLKELKAQATKEGDLINAQYNSIAEGVSFTKDNFKFAAALNLNGSLNYNLSKNEMDYNGTLSLVKADIQGIPYINSLTNIKGKLDFSKNLLKTNAITFEALNCPVELSGRLDNFENPFVDLKLKSKFEFTKVNPLIQELLQKNSSQISFDLEGETLLDSSIQGYLKDINSFKFSSDIKLTQAKLNLSQLLGLSAQIQELKLLITKEADLINAQYSSTADSINLIKGNFIFAGAFDLNGNFSYNLTKKEMDYKGSLDLSKADIRGVPYVNSASNIQGKIDFSKNLLKTNAITFEALNCPVELSGRLDNFENPFVDLKLKSKFELSKLNSTLKDFLAKNSKQISFDLLEGEAFLNSSIQGYLKQPDSIQFLNTVKLAKAKVSVLQLASPLEGIEGIINLQNDNLSWQDLSLKYKDQVFKLTGELSDFTNPLVETSLASSDLDLKTKFKVQGKMVNIAYLDGGYMGSQFNLKGDLDITEIKKPFVNLDGSLTLNLKDIGQVVNKFSKDLKLPDLEGNLKTSFLIEGPIADLRSLKVSLKGETDLVSIKGMKLRALSLNYSQGDSLAKLNLASQAYQGVLNLSANLNLLEKDILYLVDFNLEGLDLAQLKQDTPFKDKKTEGKLSLITSLNGRSNDLSKLTGSTKLTITGGNLWELNLLKGLGKLLFPASFERIVFKEAKADFIIKDNKVFTNNLKLNSDELELAFDGNFDFSGNLDFKVLSKFSENLKQQESDNPEKVLSSIISQAQRYIVTKVSGTFKDPKYTVTPYVGGLLEGILDSLKVIP